MTKILNLDQIETRRDKVVVLNGKEHVMKTLTVKEYIHTMKMGEEVDELAKDASMDSAAKILELTIDALNKVFPTIPREELEALSFPQLNALRTLTEDMATDEVEELKEETLGEQTGKS